MKIAIICAMTEEVAAITTQLRLPLNFTENMSTNKAVYNNNEIYFNLCGIGKVNAAVATQQLITTVQPDYIINVGVAGNICKQLEFGDVVIATDLLYHDMDVTSFGLKRGQIPRMDVFSFKSDEKLLALTQLINQVEENFTISHGRIVSGDQFIHKKEEVDTIQSEFNASACDMEGAAVAHTCYLNKIPFLVIRSLSDNAGSDGKDAAHSYQELKEMAASRAAYIMQQLLEKM